MEQLLKFVQLLKILAGAIGGGYLGKFLSGTYTAICFGALLGGVFGWAVRPGLGRFRA